MHSARAIRARDTLEHLRLRLPLERRIATAHECIAQVIEAVVVMPDLAFIQRKVAVAQLHDERVHERRDVHEAVQLVEDGEGEDV